MDENEDMYNASLLVSGLGDLGPLPLIRSEGSDDPVELILDFPITRE